MTVFDAEILIHRSGRSRQILVMPIKIYIGLHERYLMITDRKTRAQNAELHEIFQGKLLEDMISQNLSIFLPKVT